MLRGRSRRGRTGHPRRDAAPPGPGIERGLQGGAAEALQHAVDQRQVEAADERRCGRGRGGRTGSWPGRPPRRRPGARSRSRPGPARCAPARRRRGRPLRPHPGVVRGRARQVRTASWTGTPSRTDRSTASASTSPPGRSGGPGWTPTAAGPSAGTASPAARHPGRTVRSAAGTPRRAGPPPPAGPGGTSPSAAPARCCSAACSRLTGPGCERRRTRTAPAAPARPGHRRRPPAARGPHPRPRLHLFGSLTIHPSTF